MPRLTLVLGTSFGILFAANYSMLGNLHYAPYPETILDILQPAHPALRNRPGAILIHGGGWVTGTKAEMLPLCAPLLDNDFVVANIEYRLAATAPAPAAITDVLTAASWFADHASDYKVDPNRIIVMGLSAGGHLALMTGMLPPSANFGPATKIAAIIDIYGISDVADQIEGPGKRDYAEQWLPPGPNRLDLAKRFSPINYVRKDVPPVLAIHGDADDTVPYQQSVRLVNALKHAGAKAELITLPSGKHGISDEQANQLWPQIFKWLKKMKVT